MRRGETVFDFFCLPTSTSFSSPGWCECRRRHRLLRCAPSPPQSQREIGSQVHSAGQFTRTSSRRPSAASCARRLRSRNWRSELRRHPNSGGLLSATPYGWLAMKDKTEPRLLTHVAVKCEPGSSGAQDRLLIDYYATLPENFNSKL